MASNNKSKIEKKIGIKSFLRNGKRVKAFRRRQKVNREENKNKTRNRLLVGLGTTAALGVGGIAAAKLIKKAKNKKLAKDSKISTTITSSGSKSVKGQTIDKTNTYLTSAFTDREFGYLTNQDFLSQEISNSVRKSKSDFSTIFADTSLLRQNPKRVVDFYAKKGVNLEFKILDKDKGNILFVPFKDKNGNSFLYVQSGLDDKFDFGNRGLRDTFFFSFDKDTNLKPLLDDTYWFTDDYLPKYQKIWQQANKNSKKQDPYKFLFENLPSLKL